MNFIRQIDAKLKGAPDNVLTVGLIIAGILAWIVAIYANPTTKALVLTWVIAP
ncbi:MAG TPA: hypothetical protein VH593_29220 [Ktedonobacteraceae bacterium]|jgi:hypothetical protein